MSIIIPRPTHKHANKIWYGAIIFASAAFLAFTVWVFGKDLHASTHTCRIASSVVVRNGDNVDRLAREASVTREQFFAVNQDLDPGKLQPGDRVFIPVC